MKKLILLPALLVCACKEEVKEHTNPDPMPGIYTPDKSASFAANIVDPVCGMIRDSTWTDYSMYSGDTVWFCARAEKRAFDKNPGKYEARLMNANSSRR